MEGLILPIIIVILLFILVWNAIKIVPQYQRLVVFRLGRTIGVKGPGPVWLWPFIDRPVRVDLREQFIEVPSQTCITRDNAPIGVDFFFYSRVVSPEDRVIAVQDFEGAARNIASTT